MLLNKERAYEIMDRHGLDALVAQHQINVYYLAGYCGLMTLAGWERLYLAVLPRREDATASFVLPAGDFFNFKTEGCWMPNIVPYMAPLSIDGDEGEDGAEPPGVPFPGLPVRQGARLSPREQGWVEICEEYGPRCKASIWWALAQALKDAGLEKATIAIDDGGVPGWFEACGMAGVKWITAPEVFNDIRVVKTADEIELLAQAGKINEAACLAAAQSISDGATMEEIESIYLAEMARQGGKGIYIVSALGGLPNETYKRGEPVMVDALGTYKRYHGDIGRTVSIGPPDGELVARNKAMKAGWETALEIMRPGVLYSELSAAVIAAVNKAGFPEFAVALPHSLGLQHTDDYSLPGAPPGVKPDRPLEENMVLNIDMPHNELGWGSCHVEDTVRITKTGSEPLTTMNLDIIEVA